MHALLALELDYSVDPPLSLKLEHPCDLRRVFAPLAQVAEHALVPAA